MIHCVRCGLVHPPGQPCLVLADLPVPSQLAPLPAGTVLGGRFRLQTVAYRSRATTVYRGVDLRQHGRAVAVKELHPAALPQEERAEAAAWLAREAALLSTLSDPRLPQLLAAFDEAGRHYAVMPFLEGHTLEDRIARRGPQPEPLVLRWGQELASLLAYLHEQDPPVIHRDLKPANVLLRKDGTLVLLDLGAARRLDRAVPGTAVGTPGYAPPEQYQGRADERSDLFGLGATLHRALTGYDPEHAEPFRHPPARDLNPAIGPETALLLASLLEVVPSARPARARAALVYLRVAARDAHEYHQAPLRRMYGGMLILLPAAFTLTLLLYHRMFGDPSPFVRYQALDDTGAALRLALVFAPGLLLLLPPLRPRARGSAWAPRWRALAAALLGWGAATGAYAAALLHTRWGDYLSLPGVLSVATLQVLCALAALVGALLLARRRVARTTNARLSRHRVAVVPLCALAWIGLFLIPAPSPWPALPVLQRAQDAAFSGVAGLAADARGDLFVLDRSALRERTPDGSYHLLLDFAERCSPYYAGGFLDSFGRPLLLLTLDTAGHPILVHTALQQTYRVLAPGHLQLRSDGGRGWLRPDLASTTASTSYPFYLAAVAIDRYGRLYFDDPGTGIVYGVGRGGQYLPIRPVNAPAAWRPVALANDPAGTLYVLDAASRSLQALGDGGKLRTIARLPLAGIGGPQVPTIEVAAAGAISVTIGGNAYRVWPGGGVARLTAGGISRAVEVGGTVFASGADGSLALLDPGQGATVALRQFNPGELLCAR